MVLSALSFCSKVNVMRQDNMQGKTVFLITCLDESKNQSSAWNARKKTYLHMQHALKCQDLHLWYHSYCIWTRIIPDALCFLVQCDPLACKSNFSAKFAFYIDDVIQKWKMIIFSRQQWYDICGPCVLPHWTSIQYTTRIHLISGSSEGVSLRWYGILGWGMARTVNLV